MEISEAIAVLIATDDDIPCPFCASKAEPKFETKILENDSAALAKNMGGMPERTMRHPRADFDVLENYYVTDDISKICLNAHHVIPGNASLGKCSQILQWMAGTTTVKKRFYDKAINSRVERVKASEKDSVRSDLVAKKYPSFSVVVYGDPDMNVLFRTIAGRAAVTREKTVAKNKVTGKIDFEVNDARNGEWLPSNNAVVDWTGIAGEQALDFSGKGRPRPFPQAYAYHAMQVTKKQFHDAHPKYSAEVVKKLREIHKELEQLAWKCLAHEDTPSKEGGPYPAPQRLAGALYVLADLIRMRKLSLREAKPAAPWVTSDLSALVGERFS